MVTMQFELVSPESRVASFEADSVELPGSDGDMTVMAGHASLITTLRPGLIRARSAERTSEHVVTGGFVEVTAAGVSVLAERVIPAAEATAEAFTAIAGDEAKAAESLTGAARDAADTRVACLRALAAGLN